MFLKRTQEIQNILLLALRQSIEKSSHNFIRLGTWTPMFLDCPVQIRGSAVMKEEDALSEPPERRCTKLSGSRLALTDSISEPTPHVVERKVGEQIDRLFTERRDRGGPGPKRRRVAQRAANFDKQLLAIRNGSGPARCVL